MICDWQRRDVRWPRSLPPSSDSEPDSAHCVVQLPPSLVFETGTARRFFRLLREYHGGQVACEPRHASWFDPKANALLVEHEIARIAADPALGAEAASPGGWPGLVYYRLHGSPRKYWSVYDTERVHAWTRELQAVPRRATAWCVFDNTAGSGAAGNALQMRNGLVTPTGGLLGKIGR